MPERVAKLEQLTTCLEGTDGLPARVRELERYAFTGRVLVGFVASNTALLICLLLGVRLL
jgi:hypothetical protein